MARQTQRRARKDYPDHGISKGDLYWYAAIKTGPRSRRQHDSLVARARSKAAKAATQARADAGIEPFGGKRRVAGGQR